MSTTQDLQLESQTQEVKLDQESISDSIIRADDLDQELLDAIIIRASEQVSSTLIKYREKEREERKKLRSHWQEERRMFNQNNARYLEMVTLNQNRILDELAVRFPKPQNNFISTIWSATSEILKGAVLVSVLWYLWKPESGYRKS